MTQENQLGTLLWRGKWLVALALVVTIGLAVLVTALTAKVYEATAIFQITSPNASPGEATDLANQGLAKNYATLIVSPSFLERVKGRVAGGRLGTSELESTLKAGVVEETGLMELRARGDSPRDAQQIAGQVSAAFVSTLQRDATSRTALQQREIETEVGALSQRIDRLAGSAPRTSEAEAQIGSLRDSRDALRKQSANLVANGVAQGSSATLTAAPTAASTPVSPRPSLNLLAAIVLGLLLGIGLVYLRERLRPALHSAEDAADLLGVPVLTSVPLRRRPKPGDPVLTEAYEMLHAQLSLTAQGDEVNVVTMGSVNPAEGKTSAVEGAAYAAVRGGNNVLVVDGDLRVASLSKRLDQPHGSGLIELVEGRASLDEAIRTLGPGLDVLPANPPVANPPALLNSPRMHELIAELRLRYDLVLIDSPPLAHLADSSILASLSDGFVLVVRTGVTTPADLTAARAIVKQAGSRIIGIVVFEPRSIDKTYYPAVATPYDLTGDTAASS